MKWLLSEYKEFPSPTGVNYYESKRMQHCFQDVLCQSFRPQQGLTIMNKKQYFTSVIVLRAFPSPTGVNYYELEIVGIVFMQTSVSFRPQQGLTIMNHSLFNVNVKPTTFKFPSPTGVNYYE